MVGAKPIVPFREKVGGGHEMGFPGAVILVVP